MSEYTKGLTAEQLIECIANDYVELSHEKIVVQRNDFIATCQEWLQKNLSETCIKQKDYSNTTLLRCPRCWESMMVPHRPWVGLTDEDKKEYVSQDFGGNRLDAMDWAEKRLKEKNNVSQ